MKLARLFAFCCLAYIITVACVVEAFNSLQPEGLLQGWHQEQQDSYGAGESGSGQGKMRGYGEFQNILLLFGTWVYPASVFGALHFKRFASSAELIKEKVFHVGLAMICLMVLARFFYLGVFSAATGWG